MSSASSVVNKCITAKQLLCMLLHILRWQTTDILLETGREVRRRSEAYHSANLRNGVAPFKQQFTRLIKTDAPDKVGRRFTGYGIHLEIQWRTAHTKLTCQLIRGEVFITDIFFYYLNSFAHEFLIQIIRSHFSSIYINRIRIIVFQPLACFQLISYFSFQ